METSETTPGYCRLFKSIRVRRTEDVPPPDSRLLDVAVLDMNHDWPNLGHDSIVSAIDEICADLDPWLEPEGLSVRILSYDVRKSRMIPPAPGGRLSIYVGTGGPGELDPRRNDGRSKASQGIVEDASWEEDLFALFDAILRHEDAALLGVCHTFGVLCRWAGVARAELRLPAKGGKSSGVVRNVLTREALEHPWFQRFAARLPDGRHFPVLDNRLFDLMPRSGAFPPGLTPLSYESVPGEGAFPAALTMMEFARDRTGVIPRILASNHHPEIVGRRGQREILEKKFVRGEVTREWYEERVRSYNEIFSSAATEQGIRLTSRYTLLAPLRFHLYRQLRERARSLGLKPAFHEDSVLET